MLARRLSGMWSGFSLYASCWLPMLRHQMYPGAATGPSIPIPAAIAVSAAAANVRLPSLLRPRPERDGAESRGLAAAIGGDSGGHMPPGKIPDSLRQCV